jgi:glutathione S-transferase
MTMSPSMADNVQVLTGSFLVRLLTHVKAGLVSGNFIDDVEEQAPNFYRWAEAVAVHPSVTRIFDEDVAISGAKRRIAKARATAVNGA